MHNPNDSRIAKSNSHSESCLTDDKTTSRDIFFKTYQTKKVHLNVNLQEFDQDKNNFAVKKCRDLECFEKNHNNNTVYTVLQMI